MKYKVLVPGVLVLFVILGWYSLFSGAISTNVSYKKLVKQGDESFEKELYQQAWMYYEKALDINSEKKIEDKILESYKLFYEEQDTTEARDLYINALTTACGKFPNESEYWEEVIQRNMDASNYGGAMNLCMRAKENDIKTEKYKELSQKILYSYSDRGYTCSAYKNDVNGYFVAQVGTTYTLLSSDAEEYESNEEVEMGYVGENQIYLAKDINNHIRFIDMEGIIRGKVDLELTEYGMYSEGFCSAKYQDEYCFIDLDGNILIDKLQYAGCFQGGKAVIQTNEGKWALINTDGEICSEYFEDIKVDYAGRYLFNERIIAKKNGTYKFYDEKLKKLKGKFEAEDVDIPVESGLLAYCENGKWGFVDYDGKVQIEPQYEMAKSMMHGLAAVSSNEEWGFINKENQLVVPYQYYEAGYMSEHGVCYVSDTVDVYKVIIFNFANQFM